jgi:hypothetical protein
MSARAKSKYEQRSELLEQVRSITRRHRMLVDRLSRAELLADSIAFDMAQLEECLESNSSAEDNGSAMLAARNDISQIKESLQRTVKAGALSLEISMRAEGMAEVSVDGGKRFELPPLLADLLQVLSMPGGQSDDDMSGWKTLGEVAILLGKKVGRQLNRHAVSQNIYRLRKELFNRGGVNPYLVQTNPRRGARFAVRRKPVIQSDR